MENFVLLPGLIYRSKETFRDILRLNLSKTLPKGNKGKGKGNTIVTDSSKQPRFQKAMCTLYRFGLK